MTRLADIFKKDNYEELTPVTHDDEGNAVPITDDELKDFKEGILQAGKVKRPSKEMMDKLLNEDTNQDT